VIVPPVTHKSGILHNKVKKLWSLAETALKKANEIIIFGYSCPTMDFESINLIQRAVNYKKSRKKISIIDPDSDVLKRYADLISPERLYYYPLPKYFLQDN
jgi:bifunctional ADP-heptose synthase (sugar kinase/adenylyltransferase)